MSATTDPDEPSPVAADVLAQYMPESDHFRPVHLVEAVELQMKWLDAADAWRSMQNRRMLATLVPPDLIGPPAFRRVLSMAMLGAVSIAAELARYYGHPLGEPPGCDHGDGYYYLQAVAPPPPVEEQDWRYLDARVGAQAISMACNGEFESMATILASRLLVTEEPASMLLGLMEVYVATNEAATQGQSSS